MVFSPASAHARRSGSDRFRPRRAARGHPDLRERASRPAQPGLSPGPLRCRSRAKRDQRACGPRLPGEVARRPRGGRLGRRMGRLEGKVAIVTGGSRGIGRGIVERFLAEGASVLATARRAPEQAMAAASNLAFVAADVARAGDAAEIVTTAVERFGGLDILVNNAGIQLQKSLEDTSEAEWDEVMAVN